MGALNREQGCGMAIAWGSLGGLYLRLVGGILLGIGLGRVLPGWVPQRVGWFLFWIGVPVSCVAFIRRADLSAGAPIAIGAAWLGMAIAVGCTAVWFLLTAQGRGLNRAERGSLMIGALFGNTGYLGYPVTLTLVGDRAFGWALFFDLFGTTLGAYCLGSMVAAWLSGRSQGIWQSIGAGLANPTFLGAIAGVMSQEIALPTAMESALQGFAWTVVGSALVLIGMRLSRWRPRRSLAKVWPSLLIKVMIVPLGLGLCLRSLGITSPLLLTVVLQAAMPPAFATLVIAEAYDLDRELAVTVIAVGTGGILLLLPVWLWIFG